MKGKLRVFNQQKEEITGAICLVLRRVGDSANTYLKDEENELVSGCISWSDEYSTNEENIENLSEKMSYEIAVKVNDILKGMTRDEIKYLDKDLNEITSVLLSFYEYDANCEVFEFYINGKNVENDFDIIDHEDIGEDNEPCNYGHYCINNKVVFKEPTQEILEQYNITEDEFRFIQQQVKVCFVEGSCNWCN